MTARGDAARRLWFGAHRAARRASGVLPGPLRRSARRAREAIVPEQPLEQRLSPPLGEEDVIELYQRSVLQQSFYDETYAVDLLAASPIAHDDLARALVQHLAPASALDVGCGLGELVAKLRARDVEAVGCDFSEAFLRLAPRRARPHLRQADVTALPYPDHAFDVVTCMELLEHLPVPTIDRAIESLRRVTGGTLIVTTPSFGPDGDRRHGLPINEPSWWEDARENRPFRRIVVGPDGLPDCGHLTLATFRWWTERFLRHGLARNTDLELALLDEGARPLRRHGWSLYALHEVRSPEFVVDETDRRQGGGGFGPPVEGPDGRRGRFTGARASLHLRPEPGWGRAALALSVWAGPVTLAHDRRLDVTVEPGLPDEGAAPVRASFRVRPGGWRELTVPDVPVDGGILKVSLETDLTTLPPRLTPKGPVAEPAVGICLARAALVPTGDRVAVDPEAQRLGPPVLETPELRLVGVERRRGAAELTVAVTATPELEALAAEAARHGAPL
ncbi:MAG: hypothetical protein QOF98_1836, partial [Streptomyces sp.]|nr:hypothetical protein [Streptomyces sp.]